MPNLREVLARKNVTKETGNYAPEIALPPTLTPQQLAHRLEDFDWAYKKALKIYDPNDFTMARCLAEHALTISGWQPVSRFEINDPVERDHEDLKEIHKSLPPQLPIILETELIEGKRRKLQATIVNFIGIERIMKQVAPELGQTDFGFAADRGWEEYMSYDPFILRFGDISQAVAEARENDKKKYISWKMGIEKKILPALGNSEKYRHLDARRAIRSIALGIPLDEEAARKTMLQQELFLNQFRQTKWAQWIRKRELQMDEEEREYFV